MSFRSHRRNVIGFAVIVPAMIGACFVAIPGPVTTQAANVSSARPPLSATKIQCDKLSLEDLPDLKKESSTVLDEHNGLLQIEYYTKASDSRTITIDYRNDAECLKKSELKHLVDDSLDASKEFKKKQCAGLKKEREKAGSEEIKVKGREVDKAALDRYMTEECA